MSDSKVSPDTQVEVQIECALSGLPTAQTFLHWIEAARRQRGEVCVRVVDEAEGRSLNAQWRDRDYATNVLSFPGGDAPEDVPEAIVWPLGDLVLCAPVIAREASAQGKKLADHFAHLVVHGMLHLQGFDHVQEEAAVLMEALEIQILAELGVADPYS